MVLWCCIIIVLLSILRYYIIIYNIILRQFIRCFGAVFSHFVHIRVQRNRIRLIKTDLTCFQQHASTFRFLFFLQMSGKSFFVNQFPVAKISGKTAIWTIFSFSVSSTNYTSWEFMLLMQQSHVQRCIQLNLLFNAQNSVLPKKFWKIKILPHLPRCLSRLFWFQKLSRLIK